MRIVDSCRVLPTRGRIVHPLAVRGTADLRHSEHETANFRHHDEVMLVVRQRCCMCPERVPDLLHVRASQRRGASIA